MILYHGTNADFIKIDLEKGQRYKDFGKGFYLTPDKETAVRMATKKARLFGGTATLISYEFDESAFQSDLKIKVFPKIACDEWFLFIDANRNRNNRAIAIHDYDIVIGPIANDGVVLLLTNFHDGIYSSEQAAKLLQDKYLDQQYYFGSYKAIGFLNRIKSETI